MDERNPEAERAARENSGSGLDEIEPVATPDDGDGPNQVAEDADGKTLAAAADEREQDPTAASEARPAEARPARDPDQGLAARPAPPTSARAAATGAMSPRAVAGSEARSGEEPIAPPAPAPKPAPAAELAAAPTPEPTQPEPTPTPAAESAAEPAEEDIDDDRAAQSTVRGRQGPETAPQPRPARPLTASRPALPASPDQSAAAQSEERDETFDEMIAALAAGVRLPRTNDRRQPDAAERSEPQDLGASSAIGPSEVRRGQALLARLNLYRGRIDGFAGARTSAAISAFERQMGMKQTGRLSQAVLAALATEVSSSGLNAAGETIGVDQADAGTTEPAELESLDIVRECASKEGQWVYLRDVGRYVFCEDFPSSLTR